jgi:mycofactocin system transcriptional regulator
VDEVPEAQQVNAHEGAGRPPVTSRAELERCALELFAARGFAAITVEAIAAKAGVSRRTFFRYYASKNDVVWGDFDALLRHLEEWLASSADNAPLLPTLAQAVIRFNSVAPEALAAHRQRMSLILHVPALQAHSTLRYADWRRVVARFAARRLHQPEHSMLPQLVGHVALGAAVTAYEQWLADEDAELEALMAASFAALQFHVRVGGGGDL